MKALPTLVLCLSACMAGAPATSFAGPATDAFGACLADNTTGKERKELARWVFLAISAHPQISDISKATDAMRDRADHDTASLFMNLVTDRCSAQAAKAYQDEGPQSFQAAFESLGRVAMTELMSNPQVSASISTFSKYIDSAKVEAVLKAPAKK